MWQIIKTKFNYTDKQYCVPYTKQSLRITTCTGKMKT